MVNTCLEEYRFTGDEGGRGGGRAQRHPFLKGAPTATPRGRGSPGGRRRRRCLLPRRSSAFPCAAPGSSGWSVVSVPTVFVLALGLRLDVLPGRVGEVALVAYLAALLAAPEERVGRAALCARRLGHFVSIQSNS